MNEQMVSRVQWFAYEERILSIPGFKMPRGIRRIVFILVFEQCFMCSFLEGDREQTSNQRLSRLTEAADGGQERAEGKELDKNSNVKISNDADSSAESTTSQLDKPSEKEVIS